MNVISLGAGVQSTTLLLMACKGELDFKPDFAVFSDTGWEPESVYNHLRWLVAESEKHGIPVYRTMKGNIREDILLSVEGKRARFVSIPIYVRNQDGEIGMSRRQCTKEYKIEPIHKEIRERLGYYPRQRIKEKVNLHMGISLDEVQRMKPSRVPWIIHRYPLIDQRMTRSDCLAWMRKNGYPEPPKSSCIGCPFHSDRQWLDMKRRDPEAWSDAVKIDNAIRKLPRFKGEAYLHRSGKPLDEVDLQEDQLELDLFVNECEGMCGV
ncbi:hypothetical protein [Effusibacillus consociatus]|uniref:Phosphoadenosine phosphosulphate reductase domain-containing protein n=1 Tax=Effusibacillus consociatus TaxID=1117041 RepID=A0ABV9Q4J3_9BACL